MNTTNLQTDEACGACGQLLDDNDREIDGTPHVCPLDDTPWGTGRNGLVWLVMTLVDHGPTERWRYMVDVIILDGLPGERSRYVERTFWRIDSLADPAYVLAPGVGSELR